MRSCLVEYLHDEHPAWDYTREPLCLRYESGASLYRQVWKPVLLDRGSIQGPGQEERALSVPKGAWDRARSGTCRRSSVRRAVLRLRFSRTWKRCSSIASSHAATLPPRTRESHGRGCASDARGSTAPYSANVLRQVGECVGSRYELAPVEEERELAHRPVNLDVAGLSRRKTQSAPSSTSRASCSRTSAQSLIIDNCSRRGLHLQRGPTAAAPTSARRPRRHAERHLTSRRHRRRGRASRPGRAADRQRRRGGPSPFLGFGGFARNESLTKTADRSGAVAAARLSPSTVVPQGDRTPRLRPELGDRSLFPRTRELARGWGQMPRCSKNFA